MKSSILLTRTAASFALLVAAVNAGDMDLIEGPVEVLVGDDPDMFDMGWVDGVCYVPIEGARAGDKIAFTNFFTHNVYLMPSKEAMEMCDFSNAVLLSSMPPYEYVISANDVAENDSLFFACGVGSHCFGEQKMRVDLSSETGPRSREDLPVSKIVLGTSASSCQMVRNGQLSPEAASRVGESECTEPEYREATEAIDRPHYFRSCLGPPITLTPGGVVNQAFLLNFPFPTDRRVLIGLRTWEFVQGDIGSLEPVEVNQLYVHHMLGTVVFGGTGAENIRGVEEDAAFKLPYGLLSGDFDDIMTFHLIDLRETEDEWLECLECRCKDGMGTYLGTGGSGEGAGPQDGGIYCCTNCTDLLTPTIDYRLRYNVTYSELSDIDVPIEPINQIIGDVALTVDRYIEFDVPQWENLTEEHRLEGNPKVQVLERRGTLREMFGGFLPGSVYTDNDILEIHRCVGHLHIAALGMWMYDDLTDELICHNDVVYGDDPVKDKGFLKAISVTNYDPPLKILSDRRVRIVTHYDAEELHTGVMGLITLFVAEKEKQVTEVEAKLNADICAAPTCDVAKVLPNGGCRNSIEDSIICMFGGVCKCDQLLSLRETVGGCQGVYMSSFGNITVGSVCAEHCGCGEDLLEESIVEQIRQETKNKCHYSGEDCTRYLSNVYACAEPWAEGSDGFDENVMAVVARRGKRMALEGTKLGSESMHRFDAVAVTDRYVSPCDPNDYPVEEEVVEEESTIEGGGSNFSPIYLFPVVVALIFAALGVYSYQIRKGQNVMPENDVVVEAEKVASEDLL